MIHNKYFEIMKEFLKGYFLEIYGRELIGKVELSQKSIANTLIELENKGIIQSKSRGNHKYYSLNFSNPLLRDNLLVFENLRKLEFLMENKKLIDFSNKVSGKIVCVFGSYAKGMNKKGSDLDLLVVGGNSKDIFSLGKEYGLDVQIFNISLKDFKKGFEDNLVLKECLNNHVILKGGDLFVKEVLKWKF